MSYENSRLEPGEQLFLRGCGPGGRARGGFVWPLTVGATVEAPDWSSEPYCGRGLHGNLNGEGDSSVLIAGGPGLVVAACGAVDLLGKHKFQRCRILFVGVSLQEAATWLASHPDLPRGSVVHYATATAGDGGTATAGRKGTATAGEGGCVCIRGHTGRMHCKEIGPDDAGKMFRLNAKDEFEVVQ